MTTMKQQLNFSFQEDLKNEQDTFNYFFIMTIQYKKRSI